MGAAATLRNTFLSADPTRWGLAALMQVLSGLFLRGEAGNCLIPELFPSVKTTCFDQSICQSHCCTHGALSGLYDRGPQGCGSCWARLPKNLSCLARLCLRCGGAQQM